MCPGNDPAPRELNTAKTIPRKQTTGGLWNGLNNRAIPLGKVHKHMVVVVDRYKKMVRSIPMKGINGIKIAQAFA